MDLVWSGKGEIRPLDRPLERLSCIGHEGIVSRGTRISLFVVELVSLDCVRD